VCLNSMNKKEPVGVYIHVPFCDGKCPYCDFYSLYGNDKLIDEYTQTVSKVMAKSSEKWNRTADTLYFGGGTPNLLGQERLSFLIKTAKEKFGLENAEITVEVNPAEDLSGFLEEIKKAGANRLSIGLQSANEDELKLLGRRHTVKQAEKAVKDAQNAGFKNISLDLMLAIQKQTKESLLRSINFCAEMGVQHISAYLLKIEPKTLYYRKRDKLDVPNDDEAAELYLTACEELEKRGFMQYEISNFAKPGFESRHNLKYWDCKEYIGIGPAAHSFMDGKRFYYNRDIKGFMHDEEPALDGKGGSFEEYAMLKLRLCSGLDNEDCRKRFNMDIPERILKAAKLYQQGGLTVCDKNGIHFTPKGFLVSNMLISEILFSK